MTDELNIDDAASIEAWLVGEMDRRRLVWDTKPHWYPLSEAGKPQNTAQFIDARIASVDQPGRTVFIGPYNDALTFWREARNVVLGDFR